ncbi:HDIG domain-containing metalloprotein [Desulforhopalus sp. 52FAK]
MTRPIPSIKQCLHFIDQYEMLDNIRDHSFMVARVAKTLATQLYLSPTALSPDTAEVIAGALMHDIAKTRCLKNNSHHAQDGQSICIELGFPEIGDIVLEHVVLRDFNEQQYRQGAFGAKELVYYADKRVRHDQVVTLNDRLAYIIERYGNADPVKEQRIKENFAATFKFEQLLFSFVSFEPEALADNLVDDFLSVGE